MKRKPFKRHSFSGCQIAIIRHTLPTKSNIVLVMVDSCLSMLRVAIIISRSLLFFLFRVDSTCFLAAIFLFTIETCHKLYHTLLSWFYSHALLKRSKIAIFCLLAWMIDSIPNAWTSIENWLNVDLTYFLSFASSFLFYLEYFLSDCKLIQCKLSCDLVFVVVLFCFVALRID